MLPQLLIILLPLLFFSSHYIFLSDPLHLILFSSFYNSFRPLNPLLNLFFPLLVNILYILKCNTEKEQGKHQALSCLLPQATCKKWKALWSVTIRPKYLWVTFTTKRVTNTLLYPWKCKNYLKFIDPWPLTMATYLPVLLHSVGNNTTKHFNQYGLTCLPFR